MRELCRRALIVAAVAAPVLIAGCTRRYSEKNPILIARKMLSFEGFKPDQETFDAGTKYCDEKGYKSYTNLAAKEWALWQRLRQLSLDAGGRYNFVFTYSSTFSGVLLVTV